jgi:hypothetical protein
VDALIFEPSNSLWRPCRDASASVSGNAARHSDSSSSSYHIFVDHQCATAEGSRASPKLCPFIHGHSHKHGECERPSSADFFGDDRFPDFSVLGIGKKSVVLAMILLHIPMSP